MTFLRVTTVNANSDNVGKSSRIHNKISFVKLSSTTYSTVVNNLPSGILNVAEMESLLDKPESSVKWDYRTTGFH